MEKYVRGLDYGSDAARAIVVNALTGETLATAVILSPLERGEILLSGDQSISSASTGLYRCVRSFGERGFGSLSCRYG